MHCQFLDACSAWRDVVGNDEKVSNDIFSLLPTIVQMPNLERLSKIHAAANVPSSKLYLLTFVSYCYHAEGVFTRSVSQFFCHLETTPLSSDAVRFLC